MYVRFLIIVALLLALPQCTRKSDQSASTTTGTEASGAPMAASPEAGNASTPGAEAAASPATGPATSMSSMAKTSMTVTLSQQNKSGQYGPANVTAVGNKTRVVINLIQGSQPSKGSEPAHVHQGMCSHLDEKTPKYTLNPVIGGKSTSVINVPMSKLASGNYTISVHRQGDMKTAVACGDFATVGGGPGGKPSPIRPVPSPTETTH